MMTPLLASLANSPDLAAFLTSVAALCVVTTLLAVLMLVADATINHYGKVALTINKDKKLEVEGGRTLLSTLKDEGIFIPSACGGRGSCGLCKCKVPSGAGEPLPTETPWLTAQERRDGIRLCCQVKVKNDLELAIPEELLSVKEYRTEVVGLRNLTHDIKELRLKLLDPSAMEYKAGQFVQVEVPPYALTDEPVYRAYSVSSEPADTGTVELEIRLVPNGICTTYVHNHLKVGDTLTINGPHGDFGIRAGEGEMICIAGGSGMAPIKSILLHMLRTGSQRPVRYFFGARSKRDLFLVEELREIERKMPNFKFIPALSAPEPDDHWTGETGLITDVVGRHVDDASDKQGYLCGSPFMIDACVKVLTSKGMPADKIFYDKFS